MHRELQFQGPLCETNVIDTARHIPNLSIFVSLIDQAGLEDIFLCAGPFTVLTPTNHAFAANPGLTSYLADLHHVEDLREVLLYHILPGLYLIDDFQNGPIGTLQGEDVAVNVTSSSITFNGAELVEGDILACNGVLQVIDEVLIPPGKYPSARRKRCCLHVLKTNHWFAYIYSRVQCSTGDLRQFGLWWGDRGSPV